MGTSSSKTVKTKYEMKHTVDEQSVVSNISKKSSIKKKNKNSLKMKEKNSHSKSASVKNQLTQGTHLCVIEEGADVTGTAKMSPGAVYRKKSSCPSCEARDILLGKHRSRSGSEKSLRFSDFNKVLRKTRIYDWEMQPLDIALEDVEDPCPDDICYICEVYTGSHVRACRVCCRAYHDSCLAKIGNPLSESCRLLIAADRWSCHQCVSLNHLLTQEEVTNVLKMLDHLQISKDNITEDNYLRFCRHCLHQDNQLVTAETDNQIVQRFRSVGQAKAGVISFTQFLNIETVRFLGRRSKDSLVHLLTKAELAEARKMFHQLDTRKTGLSSKSGGNVSSSLDKINRNPGDDIQKLEHRIRFIDEDLDSPTAWPAFLKDIALDLISQRCNPGQAMSPGSGSHDTEDATLTSSYDSMDVDEDKYSTCNSEPELPVPPVDPAGSLPQHKQLQACPAADESLGQSTKTSMLDDIHAHIEETHRCHDLFLKQAESAADNCSQKEASSVGSLTEAQVTAKPTTQQMSNLQSPGMLHQAASLHTSDQWADADLKTSTEPAQPSAGHHILIDWQGVENRSNQKGRKNGNTKAAYIKSEVITRPIVASCGRSRAVSQRGFQHLPPLPAGSLPDMGNNEQ